MNGFVRTLAYACALLFLLCASAAITLLVMAKQGHAISPEKLRSFVLSEEERAYLAQMGKRAPEPAEAKPVTPDAEEVLGHLAEMVNADRAAGLVTQLRRQKESLDEERAHLDRQWADLQLARADLVRVKAQLDGQAQGLSSAAKAQADEHARWAETQVQEAKSVQAMDAVEKARYRDQAKLFEAMKDNAWASLRRMEPKEIARYLSLMDTKKAARMLVLAQADAELPTIVTAIHREMLRLDPDAPSGSQLQRLSNLYALMPAESIMPYLRTSSADDVADLLITMGKSGQEKKRAEILTWLRVEDDRKELDVQRALAQRGETLDDAGKKPAAKP